MIRSRSRRNLLLTAVAALLLAAGGGRCGEDPWSWELVWAEEFDGTAVNAGDWNFETGDGCPGLCGWGNNELEYYRADNASVADGFLTITARKEPFEDRDYTSARMNTRDKVDFAEGRIEARIRLPVGRGIWPAFWMLGDDVGSVGWPECGEIDIMEYRGQEPAVVHGTLHGPGYSGGAALSRSYRLGEGSFADGFHVFAVEWSGDRITWLVDDVRSHTFSRDDLPGGARWVFDHPFFLILNVAVGGNFVGPPNSSTPFPQAMVVDWIRVYRRTR